MLMMVDVHLGELTTMQLRMQTSIVTRELGLRLKAFPKPNRYGANLASSWAQKGDDCPAPHPGHLFYGLGHEG